MPLEQPSNIYREQLTSLCQGLALWKPNPVEDVYSQVSIGDVGYISSEGIFIRMFNVTLPWNDRSNRRLAQPEPYDPLTPASITRQNFGQIDYYSRHMSREENAGDTQAATHEQAGGATYICRGPGALLSLPCGGHREDAVHERMFRECIRDNIDCWFNWSRNVGLPVDRMDDLILVTGCTSVTSYASAVLDDHIADAEISLVSRPLNNGGASFVWSNIRGPIEHHESQINPNIPSAPQSRCVFTRGFRAKRVLFWDEPIRAAAEPRPDDPDDNLKEHIQVNEVPYVPKNLDPLNGVLDYIAEKCLKAADGEGALAIAHDDDLQIIKSKDLETLTAGAVLKFLHENKIPVLVENGVATILGNNTRNQSRGDQVPQVQDSQLEATLLGIDEGKREYARRLFQCLAVSIRPLRVEELAEVLAIQFPEAAPPTFNPARRPENPEEAVLSVCSSLISIVDRGGHRVVQFSPSVKKYLTSERLRKAEERLSYFHILPEPAHTILAQASLSVLLQLDDKIDRNAIAHFPLAPYAAQHWVDHAKFRNVSFESHIKEVMERLFNPAIPHFAAWVWLYDIDRYWTERMPTMHPTQPEAEPLYYASLCGFVGLAEHLITARSLDVNSKGGSHTTPLHAASVKGHLEVVSLLLRNGADPDSRDHLGRVPLHKVSQGGQFVTANSPLEIARLLVNSGADVNAPDNEDWAPLHAAAQSGYREIAELLLGSGASLDALNVKQETPLDISSFNGQSEVAQFLIDRGSDINSVDEKGFIPLHAASQHGHADVARLLIDSGADVNAREKRYWTPLHQASRYGYLDLARLLIDREADVNAREAQSSTPLHHASRHGYLDATRLLIDHGADLNAQKEDGCTALHEASVAGHVDIAKLLIDRGANVDSWNDKQDTPLAAASWFGHLDIACFLIEKGAAVSSPDKEGNSALHKASRQGHLNVTKFLLECGIDVDIRNRNEQTSLFLASSNGKLDVARFLIEQGADIHIRDSDNSNPLHIASLNGHLDVVQLLVDTGIPVDLRNGSQNTPLALASSKGKAEVGRFLIDRGANLNVRDNQSQAPLHLASQHGHLDMTQLLLDHGADPNIKRDDVWTPLHLASANGHLKVAELLVQRGASVDVSHAKKKTPLYQVVRNWIAAIVCLLIDHGATVDSNGWTPLHAALQHGHLGVVKLLLRHGADVDVLDKAGRSAAELAWENGQVKAAKFISDYKMNPNTRNKLLSTTIDTVEYGAGDDEKDESKISLHAAAEEGNIDTVKSLLERGMDIDSRNASNETPLQRAAGKGNVDVVRLLIERGAEVNSRDKLGWTPLQWSSEYAQLEASRILLDHGANVNTRKQGYWTPIHVSAANKHVEVVKLLLERGADIHAMNAEGETPYPLSLRTGNPDIAKLIRENGASRLGERKSTA